MFWLEEIVRRNQERDTPLRTDPPKQEDRPRIKLSQGPNGPAKSNSKWTLFWDMHSGGYVKEMPYEQIYIEAEEKEAIKIFCNRFGHDPLDSTCSCCGKNYYVKEYDSLTEASEYHRNENYESKFTGYPEISLEDYLEHKNVLVIRIEDMK